MDGFNETHLVFGNRSNTSLTANDSSWPIGNDPPPSFYNMPPRPPLTIYTQIKEDIWRIVAPIFLLVGTVGNVLTAIVILRQFHKMTSTSIFLLTLAISDTIILYSGPLRDWLILTWDTDVRSVSDTGCKVSVYLTYVSFHMSAWLLVAVTMERVISILWPHKVKMGCTREVAGTVITIMVVVILGLNSHLIYGLGPSSLPIYKGLSTCDPLYEDYQTFRDDVWGWIDFAVSVEVPFAMILPGNIVIICYLKKSSNRRRKMNTIHSEAHRVAEKDAKVLTITLILLNVTFFICLAPVAVFFIYQPYRRKQIIEMISNMKSLDDLKEASKQNEILFLWHTIVNYISYLNAVLNFFLYIVSGSKFRNEFISFLRCRAGRGHRASVFGGSTPQKKCNAPKTVPTHANAFGHQENSGSTLPADSGMAESGTTSVEGTSFRSSEYVNELTNASKY